MRKYNPNLRRNYDFRLPIGTHDLIIDELSNLNIDTFKYRYLKQELLSKFVSSTTDSSVVRRTRAINKWLACERENEATNVRLLTTHDGFHILPHVKFGAFIEFTSSLISKILGDTVPEDALLGAFSGGASTSKSRHASQPAGKYLGKAHITSEASIWLDTIEESFPGWSQFWSDLSIDIVPGNVMFTVPKTTSIDRCACKEPDINMFLQKGAGNVIRRSLLRCGIDLNDQSRNRALAREGSVTGHLATIDLSSASDSLTTTLVELLLPEQWFSYLSSLRSRITVIDGERHVNEMFSSMGNGFTFELESLIFYALARSTAYFMNIPGVISVYGDDIIVPVDVYPHLSYVLSYVGFSVNMDKSFASGEFRESCGGHYMSGQDVTPFYVRGEITRLSDLILFCNYFRKWSEGVLFCDEACYDLWSFCASFVPKRLWGGQLYNSRFQLYTPGWSSSTLVEDSQSRNTGVGGYIHWLNSAASRPTTFFSWRHCGLPIVDRYSHLEFIKNIQDGLVTSRHSIKKSERMSIRKAAGIVTHNCQPSFLEDGCS